MHVHECTCIYIYIFIYFALVVAVAEWSFGLCGLQPFAIFQAAPCNEYILRAALLGSINVHMTGNTYIPTRYVCISSKCA